MAQPLLKSEVTYQDVAAAPSMAADLSRAGRSLARVLATASLAALVMLAAVLALPHDKFLRYQTVNEHNGPTTYWIYQRIHDDPNPIDIAFLGSSRTGLSVHSKRLEDRLAERGVRVKAANLHVVGSGINMQYVIAKELLEARKVGLLVLEMTEREERKGHPQFVYLADAADVLASPVLPNAGFFSDLARLPGRQLDLFLQTQLLARGLREPGFVVPPYEGSNLDHAEFIRTLDDGINHGRNGFHTRAEMDTLRVAENARHTPPLLPASLAAAEFRMSRYYTRLILAMAKAHGTRVAFLYLPSYGAPPEPAPYLNYADQAHLINPWPVIQDTNKWWDAVHVNWLGAQQLTDYVAGVLADGAYLR